MCGNESPTRAAFSKKNEHCSLECINPSLATLYQLLLFLCKHPWPFVIISPGFCSTGHFYQLCLMGQLSRDTLLGCANEGISSHKQGLERATDSSRSWAVCSCLNVLYCIEQWHRNSGKLAGLTWGWMSRMPQVDEGLWDWPFLLVWAISTFFPWLRCVF